MTLWWVARLSTVAQRVKGAIPPDYEDYVVKAFDVTKAKEMVDKPWTTFAADWQTLSKACSEITTLCGEVGVS